jgi:putative methyltransferase (TIGR04325 family)
MKKIIQDLLPPFAWRILRRTYLFWLNKNKYVEWEHMPKGWLVETIDPNIKGWNVDSILNAYKANWDGFVSALNDKLPFGISPESNNINRIDLTSHNIMMTYAYVLALSSLNKSCISMLDWGGGIGHYYFISKSLLPSLEIDYHCKDVSTLVSYGKETFPYLSFYSDEICLDRKYDFVLASTSLHYSQDWIKTLKGLAKATSGYLFITRLPVLQNASSYVMVQRPYQYGYNTEYLGWCLNKQEFLNVANSSGLILIREFFAQGSEFIYGAPEQPQYFGFLFKSL